MNFESWYIENTTHKLPALRAITLENRESCTYIFTDVWHFEWFESPQKPALLTELREHEVRTKFNEQFVSL